MRIRAIREDDAATLRELWEEFEAEVPPPPALGSETWEEAWADLRRHAQAGIALLAEDEEGAAGYAFVRAPEDGRAHVTDVYVRPRARRRGVATALMREVAVGLAELGADWVTLDVLTSNTAARALYERLGFEDVQRLLAAPVEALTGRAAGAGASHGRSVGAVHVQTDDQRAVVAAVERFVPRLHRSGSTVVLPPRNGWTAVHDEVADREPQRLRRLAQELSHVTGAPVLALGVEAGALVRLVAYERGQLLDEYVSVPDYYRPLPPGDAVALRANATVLARLTGAEPARIREVARTAGSASELPPAAEHAAALAATLGLTDALGYGEAAAQPGAVVVEHR